MENNELEKADLLFNDSLEALYLHSKEWREEISSWKMELNFFQKLLDTYAARCTEVEQKMKLDHFQNLIIYYNGELLDYFNQKVRRHTKHLKNHMNGQSEATDKEKYQNKSEELLSELFAFATEYRKYKAEFFQFMEECFGQEEKAQMPSSTMR